MKDNSAKFEKVFAPEEKEMLFLIGETIGEMWSMKFDFWQQGAVYLSVIDPDNGKVKAERGHIFFGCEDADVKPYAQYRVKCRELKDKVPPDDMPSLLMNDYLVTEISEREISNPRLDEILHKYLDESVYEDKDFGRFDLDRTVNMYIGIVDLFGRECELGLEYDKGDSSAVTDALTHFKAIYENKEVWDKKLRMYAAKEIVSKYGDKLNMSPEEISVMLKPSRIYAYSYGGFNVEFEDTGLIKVGEIEVETDENGNPEAVEIDE